MKPIFRISALFVLLLTAQISLAQNPARPIMENMLASLDRINTLSARIRRLERINGQMEEGELRFKLQYKPTFKAYIYQIKPDEGAEVLYVKGWNGDKAFIHPNKFPWVNVSLDPEGETMVAGQHHTLFSIGTDYTKNIFRFFYEKYSAEFDEHVKYEGMKKWYDHNCHVLKIVYNNYKFENYTVKAGETLWDIDFKLHVPAAKILEINPTIKDPHDVKAGQVIRVPNVYGKETVVLIDEKTFLPLVQIVSDDKGLFEKYEYFDIKINPRFSTTEFSTEYPDYGF